MLTTTHVDIQNQPFICGKGAAIKVDRAVFVGKYALVTGWLSGDVTMSLRNSKRSLLYARPDVDASEFQDVKGFTLVVVIGGGSRLEISVRGHGHNFTAIIICSSELSDVLITIEENSTRIAYLCQEMVFDEEWGKLLFPHLPLSGSDQAAGHLEQARCVPGVGITYTGWAVKRGRSAVWLMTDNGRVASLSDTIRFPRQDIVNVFAKDYGSYADLAGFFGCLKGKLYPGQKLAIVVIGDSSVTKIGEMVCEKAPMYALEYAKWAFSLPVPDSLFMRRLDAHDGDLLKQMLANEQHDGDDYLEMWSVGTPPANPLVSVVIPLYGRSDFVDHQMLSFSSDVDVTSGVAEVVYVIDDVRIVEELRNRANYLFDYYGVSARFLFGGRNRGFSGANNLGVKHSKGAYLLFLNSDVFPEEAGWISRMANVLINRPNYGIVGARLLYPSGALQHMGMSFRRSERYSIWLNEHPGMGMPPNKAVDDSIDVAAVTGACLAISRDDFERVKGFDESFLIGDFEDSDINLKVRRLGKDICCLQDTSLVHLERQSFKYASSDLNFRQRVVLYNGWVQNKKWAEDIQYLTDAGLK